MPVIGLGTWQVRNCAALVASALRAGYRHIDTARNYGNEAEIAEAIRASGVRREELFITTKVWHEDLRAPDFARSVEASLNALQLSYVDLLLVHWPSIQGVPLPETLKALGKAKTGGLTRKIGVANFNIAMLEEAVRACPEPLAVLQAEYHPYLDQSKLLAACRRLRLAFTAYCPLGRGRVLADPKLEKLARAKGKSIAQVVLRWLVQQGVASLPRSSQAGRVAENLEVFGFELTADEMAEISSLRQRNGRIVDPPMAPAWD
ncbi:MAG: aldo/keto reductase [Betaproteobacteria bacterium]|nr:MAG: aldo/keto reductase [Betaproteobacteria bacterium]